MRRLIVILAIACAFSGIQCGETSNVTALKLAHGLNIDHPVHLAMAYMAELAAEKSGGTLRIDLYPSQQLGTERQCLELLQIGSLAMTKVSAAVLENFAPDIKLFSLPYIFRDREHMYKVQDGDVGHEMLLQSQQYWLRGLTYFDAGSRSFYMKDQQVRTPEDLEGKKIRVQESVTAMELIRNLGGSPTPISWGELYTALQQGVVDGAENNPPSFYTSRHYEVCKYYSINEHTAVPDILVIGTVAWNQLNEQQQVWLQEAADEATTYQRKLWAEAEQEAIDSVQAAGVKIIYPDKEPFMEKTRAMYEPFMEDPELRQIITRIQNVE